jgi:hypothetical protein
MVIRTEYRGQRYSMGSSDPLPAGFEIRFGSLNFQATGTAISCASPTAPGFTHGGQPGQDQFPPRPLLTARHPPERTLRAPQRHNADDDPASALDRRGWSDVGPRASPLNATRPLARWRPLPRGSAWFPNHSSPHGMRNVAMAYASSAGPKVDEALAVDPARRVLERPLEAPAYSMTC